MKVKFFWVFLFVAIVSLIFFWSNSTVGPSSSSIPRNPDFNFDVRPILSDNCFLCHGPDSSSRQAGLRLDTYQGITAMLEHGGHAVVPGNPRKSLLLQKVASKSPDQVMPPPETKKTLTKREIGILSNWIKNGAQWDSYWAFIKPEKVEVDSDEHPIDFFINRKLQQKDIPSSIKADKNALIRRLSFVLLGLPPSIQQLESFVNNEDPDAYHQLVDSLLASPHFGERWARHWMDLVRYADTKGHEFDYPIDGAWRYRDYLIRAFNADVPYDQFVKEHLAGDLLEKPRIHSQLGFNESVMGTAFYCLSEGKHSPVDIKEEEVDRIDNMIDVTTKTFMGLTVGCAKCHDHKFDPISAEDYYALYGMLESARFTNFPASQKVADLQKIKATNLQIKEIKQFIHSNIFEREAIKDSQNSKNLDEVLVVGDFRRGGLQNWYNDGHIFHNLSDIPFASGNQLKFNEGKVASAFFGKGLQGALRSPNFWIDKDYLVIRAAGEHAMLRVIIDNFQLIQYPIYGGLHHKLDDPKEKDYYFDLSMWKGHKAYVEILNGQYGKVRTHAYHIDKDAWSEVYYAVAYDEKNALGNWLKQYQDKPRKSISKDQLPGNLLGQINSIAKVHQTLGKPLFDTTFLIGVTEGDQVESKLFIRGNHLELGESPIAHRYFTALSDQPKRFNQSNSGRLELANELTKPDHPLTARVMVNRVWHHLFGRGIVETVDNFGVQGKIPSHPELLDYLAIWFVEHDWSIKELIKFIVTSATFQKSAIQDEVAAQIDPNNTFLHHYPVRRLEAEAIRDAVLAVSGRFDPVLYGPSEPIFLTDFLKGRGRPPASGPLDGNGRRSVYLQINRNFLSPNMMAFDMPTPFTTFGKRNVSNVPAQSLTMMNDPFVKAMAEFWANEIQITELSFEDKVQSIYQKAFSRKATLEELATAEAFFTDENTALDKKKSLEKWTDYCHIIFNTKAFIYLS